SPSARVRSAAAARSPISGSLLLAPRASSRLLSMVSAYADTRRCQQMLTVIPRPACGQGLAGRGENFGPGFRWASGVRWFAGAEPVGLGAGLEDVGVEGDPVDDGGNEPGVGEDGSPFAERQVRADRDRGFLVPFGDDLEQQFGAAGVDLDVAQLI